MPAPRLHTMLQQLRQAAGMKLLVAGLAVVAVTLRVDLEASPTLALQDPQHAEAMAEAHGLHPSVPARGTHVDRFGDPLPDGVVARMGSGRMRPGSRCENMVFSPDGKLLAPCDEHALRLWDVASGKQRHKIAIVAHWTAQCVFSADGIRVAALQYPGKTLVLYCVNPMSGATDQPLQVPTHASVASLAFSADGRILATVSDKSVLLYDPRNGRELSRIPIPGARPFELALSPAGDALAVASLTDTVHLYDGATGKLKAVYKHAGDRIRNLSWSPDGRFVAAASWPDAGKLSCAGIWDVRTGKEIYRLRSAEGYILAVAFSPDGRYVALGSQYPAVVLWDLRTGKEVRRFPQSGLAGRITFSCDGKILAAAANNVIRLWDVATGKPLPGSADPLIGGVRDLHFSAKGERLFGSAGRPVAWDVHTGRESDDLRWLGTPSWRNLLSPDGSVVANIALDDTLALFASYTGKPLHTLGRSKSFGWGMAFSPDDRRLYTTTIGQPIDEWDVATGRRLRALDSAGKNILWLTASPNGRWLASATGVRGGRDVTLWDLTAGRERATYKLRAGSFFAFAFSPDSRLLATVEPGASGLGEIKLWDMASGTVWRSIVTSKKPSPAVAFSPDGRMLATGGEDGSLLLWELTSGRIRHRFVGHQDWIGSLAFSPNGRYLAAASTDAPVFIWDVMDGSARPTALSPAVLDQAWTTLAGDDAAAAWQAVKMLAAAPARSVPFLQKHLHPAAKANQKQLEQLIARLDSPRFAVRQHATAELAQSLEQAEPLLRKALTSHLSAEAQRRIKQLLQELDPPTGERLRQLRAVEVLEYAATPAARRLLAELARSVPEAGVTRAAKAALRRLVRLPMTRPPKAGAALPRGS